MGGGQDCCPSTNRWGWSFVSDRFQKWLGQISELGLTHAMNLCKVEPESPPTPYHVLSMPRGPKGEKRPADVIGNAVCVMKIATGQIEDAPETDDKKDPAAQALGRKGGWARAKAMTPERRAEIARKAAERRWKK